MRQVIFAVMLVIAAALIATGVSLFSVPIGLIVAGVEVAALSWVILADIGGVAS